MSKVLIEHTSSHGCLFTSTSLDLSGGVMVRNISGASAVNMMKDYFEFGAWFSNQIHPQLNSFSGFDTVNFILQTN